MTNDELIATAAPLIGKLGADYYFTPATISRGKALGLNYGQFYVMGRGGVLGDVEPATVWSAFGYFNPTMVDAQWNAAKAVMAPREAAREHFACAAAHGRDKFSEIEGIDAFVAAADAVADAADAGGLSLFAAYRAEPRVEDAPGRAQQLLAVLREHRGGAHLIALRAAGVESKAAHFAKRPNDIAMFGWTADDAPEITDATRAAIVEAEAITDKIVAPAYDVLDDAGRAALVNGLQAIAATYG